MRNDLAIEYPADKTCPVTTEFSCELFQSVVEELNAGKDIEKVTPFGE